MQIVLFFLDLNSYHKLTSVLLIVISDIVDLSQVYKAAEFTLLYDTTKWRPRFRMLRRLQCHIVKHITDFRTGKEEDNGVAAEIETTWLSA